MTRQQFLCETTENELEVLTFDNFIEISIDTGKEIYAVHLTINDAERFMDAIHNKIIQIEGGKNG